MLELKIYDEFFDEDTERFIKEERASLKLEHSLLAVSKWESKYRRAFLKDEPFTDDQIMYYISCMSDEELDMDYLIDIIGMDEMRKIEEYITTPQTATHIAKLPQKGPPSREVVTSELIYYWMVSYRIPIETQRWHLSRLLALIDVFNAKSGGKKMDKRQIAKQYRETNAARLGNA